MSTEENKLIGIREAALFLGVTEIHLRKLLRDGIITYVNVAGGKSRKSIRIERDALREFIKQGGVQKE
jgi:excisionase family DNA binding protein